MHSPIEQFEIHTLTPPLFQIAGYPVAITTSTIYMAVAILSAVLFMGLAMRRQAVVPGRWQMLAETVHDAAFSTMEGAAGDKARPFFPFIFSIFLFVAFCNLWGMMPHTLTVTSHLVVNLALAAILFTVIIATGFARHGLHFLHLFVPSGVPVALMPFMVLIELVSFLIRPFSLSIRLFANMMAGHILMKVFAGMTAGLAMAGWLSAVGVFPLILNIAVVGFEFFVALLQAYIFALLSSVYLRDALEMH